MMPESNNKINNLRRKFLGGLMAGIGGVLTFSKVARASDQGVKDSVTTDQKISHKGYHETAHVKSYYEKARF